MKKSNFYFLFIFTLILFTGCTSDDPVIDDNSEIPAGDTDRYVIASTPLATDGVADYLLTANDLSEGKISLVGNGIEQDGTFRYYVTHNNRFFSLLYGRGNPGAVTAYELNAEGELSELIDFQAETVHVFAPVNDDVLMIKIPRDGSPNASWYQLNAESIKLTNQGQMDVFELAGNDEQAFFTWITQVGDYVFAPFMSIKACCNDTWGTAYPDSAWVAVYSYPEMELQKVIKDDRTSFIGRYFSSGLEEVENGDVYAFSSSTATSNDVFTSTKPSAVTRINSGELEFDEEYFFNLEEASGGYYITSQIYAGNGKFVAYMQPVAEKAKYVIGEKLAVVDVFNESLTWISGLPAPENIISISTNNIVSEDGATVYVGVTTEESSYVYNIDVASAQATQGLEVEGGVITAISELEIEE